MGLFTIPGGDICAIRRQLHIPADKPYIAGVDAPHFATIRTLERPFQGNTDNTLLFQISKRIKDKNGVVPRGWGMVGQAEQDTFRIVVPLKASELAVSNYVTVDYPLGEVEAAMANAPDNLSQESKHLFVAALAIQSQIGIVDQASLA